MSRINRELVKAGLKHLLDKDREAFIENLSIYLHERVEVLDYLFKGPLPINEIIEELLENYIKDSLPCPENFKSIVSIEIGFDYACMQQYNVTYTVGRYYNTDKQPYGGQELADDEHPVCIITEVYASINPNSIKL